MERERWVCTAILLTNMIAKRCKVRWDNSTMYSCSRYNQKFQLQLHALAYFKNLPRGALWFRTRTQASPPSDSPKFSNLRFGQLRLS